MFFQACQWDPRARLKLTLKQVKLQWHKGRRKQDAPSRVEFLFRVLLGIGALFRVVTPHSSVLLPITSRLVFSLFLDLRGNLGIVKEKSFLLSNDTTTMVILLWEFLMLHQIFLSPRSEAWLLVINWYIRVESRVAGTT